MPEKATKLPLGLRFLYKMKITPLHHDTDSLGPTYRAHRLLSFMLGLCVHIVLFEPVAPEKGKAALALLLMKKEKLQKVLSSDGGASRKQSHVRLII